jgi:hypothetical protein
MQELDAERRIQILRGEIPTPLPIEDKPEREDGEKRGRRDYGSGRERKRRKKAGENDTEFEMRVAREDQDVAANANNQLVLRKDVDAPLVDHTGHISLFPQEQKSAKAHILEKNAEAEKEAQRKKREYEDQYTMRFSNAAGFKNDIGSAPWYSKAGVEKEVVEEMPGKDVWGNEDPRRKEREQKRVVDNDPLAMMKAGAAQVRQMEKERQRWREEKEKEMRALDIDLKKRKRRHDDNEDDLEDFRLDEPERGSSKRSEGERDKERRHRHKHRSRSSHHKEERRHKHRHRHHD